MMKKIPTLRWLARIIGFVALVLFLVLVIGESVSEFSWDGVVFAVIPGLVIAAGYVLSWFREQSGAWLLLAGYVLFSFSPTIYDAVTGDAVGFYWAIPAILSPFLVAGVLFLVSSRMEVRTSS